MTQAGIKHISIRIDKGLDRWLRIEAAKRDTSKSELIRCILLRTACVPEEIDVDRYSWKDRVETKLAQGNDEQ
jgi:hypothetical protein